MSLLSHRTFAFAMSGKRTIASEPIIVVGAVIKGRAIPDTSPYSAVASFEESPFLVSISGTTIAVREATRPVEILSVVSGSEDLVSSKKPCGLAILPPLTKNTMTSTKAQTQSAIRNATAIAVAPLIQDTAQVANKTVNMIFKISSNSSVTEKAKNFFLPIRNALIEQYIVDVIRAGSIIRNKSPARASLKIKFRCERIKKHIAMIIPDVKSPIKIDANVSAFCRLKFLNVSASAIFRDKTVGIPPTEIESNSKSTERHI